MACLPLQEHEEVEPGEEDGDGGTLPLQRTVRCGQERSDEDGRRDVEDPLEEVDDVVKVVESLRKVRTAARLFIGTDMCG